MQRKFDTIMTVIAGLCAFAAFVVTFLCMLLGEDRNAAFALALALTLAVLTTLFWESSKPSRWSGS